MTLNQPFQRLEIFPESGASLATPPLVLQVARLKQTVGICNIWSPAIIYVLHNRMVLIPCVCVQYPDQAQIDPQDLIELEHLLA